MHAKDRDSMISFAKSGAHIMTFEDEVIFIPIVALLEAPRGADNIIYCWHSATT